MPGRINDVTTATTKLKVYSLKITRKFSECLAYYFEGRLLYYELAGENMFKAHLVIERKMSDYLHGRLSQPNMLIMVDNQQDADCRLLEEGFTLDI